MVITIIIILLLGKAFCIQKHSKTQTGEESSSSECFSPVGYLQQLGCLVVTLLE